MEQLENRMLKTTLHEKANSSRGGDAKPWVSSLLRARLPMERLLGTAQEERKSSGDLHEEYQQWTTDWRSNLSVALAGHFNLLYWGKLDCI